MTHRSIRIPTIAIYLINIFNVTVSIKNGLVNISTIILRTLKLFQNVSCMEIFVDVYKPTCSRHLCDVLAQDVDSFDKLLQSTLDLIWYVAAITEEIRYQEVALPEVCPPILQLATIPEISTRSHGNKAIPWLTLQVKLNSLGKDFCVLTFLSIFQFLKKFL